MTLTNRFKTVERGGMVLTGNALTLMKGTDVTTGDYYNGAYMSTDTSLVAATGFPAGTTYNPANSSSSAVLNIPSGSTILYAHLFWTVSPDSGSSRDNAITFITPAGTNTITPTISDVSGTNYFRGAVVTSIIANAGSGTYTFGNIPGVTIVNNSTIGGYSWNLIVVYKNTSFKYRYFNVNTGISNVANGSPSAFTFSNIATPSVGAVKGYLLVSEILGDLADGAEVYVGSASPGTRIGNSSGTTWDGNAPYSKINNMFPGNILVADTNDPNIGLLDTRGSFGSNNKNPFAPLAPAYSRMCVDIAGFDISSKLSNNQTSLYTNVNYSGSGSGQITSQSVQVDLNTPEFGSGNFSMAVDKGQATLGETLTYTLVFKNTGQAAANSVYLMDTMPTGLAYIPGSVVVDGTTQPTYDPRVPGINLGSINSNTVTTIAFKALVSSLPATNPIQKTSQGTFSFLLSVGYGNVFTDQISTTAITTINSPDFRSSTITVNKYLATITDELTYTVVLKNTGLLGATSINFVNTIPAYTSFKSGSVNIDSVTYPNLNVDSPGFIYPINMIAGAVSTLQYKIVVNSIPSINPIANSALLNYFYTYTASTVPSQYSSSYNTDTVNTTVKSAIISTASKSVDKAYADMGETITYTIVLNNSGNSNTTNAVFKDTLPSDTSFISNSFKINGVTQSGVNPTNSALIANLQVGVTTLNYSIKATTIPAINPVINSGTVTYNYSTDPSIPNSNFTGLNLNYTSTQINTVFFDTIKTANKDYSYIGDKILYTINLINRGSVTANNVIVIDTMPSSTTFVADSLALNGVNQSGASILPDGGFYLGNIPALSSNTISFLALVNSIPSNNIVRNLAGVSYRYSVIPNAWPISNFSTSNYTSVTTINSPYFATSSILSSKSFAYITDEFNYTIVLRNTGNVAATSINFINTIPNGLIFKGSSIYVDGVNYPSYSPNLPGFSYPYSINAGGVSTVTFKVTVTSIPSTNLALNSAYISYNYTVNSTIPNGVAGNYTTNSVRTNINKYNLTNSLFVSYQYTPDPTVPSDISGSVNSNSVVSTINFISLVGTQTVDRAYSDVGESLTYTIVYNNTGSTSANTAIISTVPTGVSLIGNSLVINGGNQSNTASASSITITSIPVGITTISYRVKVDTIPTVNPLQNTMNVNYVYTVFPTIPNGYSGYSGGNTVSTKINAVFLYSTKTVSKSYANIGDVLTYTIPITNTGNITANNAILKDTIPDGIALVANSISLNGVTQGSGSVNDGFNMGTLPIGVSTLSFKVIVNSIPSINPIANSAVITYNYSVDPSVPNGYTSGINTNIANTKVNAAILSSIKTVDKAYANIGDTIMYTIPIKNLGSADATTVKILDTIPTGGTFITNSLLVNGVTQTGTTPNSGYVIGTISAGTIATIQFKVQISTIPSSAQVSNSAILTYKYTVDPSVPNGSSSSYNTNVVITQLKTANLKNAVKQVSKSYVDTNERLTYTLIIPNVGTVDATNVIVIDTIPIGTTFEANSVTVNGVSTSETPFRINVGTIPVNTVAAVTFNVIMNK